MMKLRANVADSDRRRVSKGAVGVLSARPCWSFELQPAPPHLLTIKGKMELALFVGLFLVAKRERAVKAVHCCSWVLTEPRFDAEFCMELLSIGLECRMASRMVDRWVDNLGSGANLVATVIGGRWSASKQLQEDHFWQLTKGTRAKGGSCREGRWSKFEVSCHD